MPPCPVNCCAGPIRVTSQLACSLLSCGGCVVTATQDGVPVPGSPWTADSSGVVTFTPPSRQPVTITVTSPDPRYAPHVETVTPLLYPTVLDVSVTLFPAAGYSCLKDCPEPVANTLHASSEKFGTFTLDHIGLPFGITSSWVAKVVRPFLGCFQVDGTTICLPEDPGQWTFTLNSASDLIVGLLIGSDSHCPFDDFTLAEVPATIGYLGGGDCSPLNLAFTGETYVQPSYSTIIGYYPDCYGTDHLTLTE